MDGIHVAYVVFVCYVVRLLFGVGNEKRDGEGIWKKGERRVMVMSLLIIVG